MSRLTLYLLFTIGLLPITSHAQKHIQGTVKDADSKTPLPEASILVEGTQTGTIANQNGTFTLDLWQLPAVIRVSHIGYHPQRTIISEKSDTTWAVLLQPETLMMDEIIVTAHHNYLQQLTTDGGWDGVWSPTGKHIAFTKIQNKNADIWIHATDSDKVTQFTTHPTWDASPTWSPNGQTLAFTSYRGDSLNIWIKNIQTGNIQQITSNSDFVADDFDYGARYQGGHITWVPNGESIVFSKKSGKAVHKRYIRSLWEKSIEDTSSAKPFLTPSRWSIYNARWAPNQSQIAFASTRGIIVTHTDVEQQIQRVANGHIPAWSPDGKWLAFTENNKNGIQDLWVQNIHNGARIQLTNTPTKEESAPHWSPAGKQLLFTMREAGYDLWMLKRDASNPIRVASGIAAADWSPDGQSIGFVAHTDQGLTLFKTLVSESHWIPLSKPSAIPSPVGSISWSPNKRFIIGTRHHNQNELWQYDLVTQEYLQVIRAEDLEQSSYFWQHSTPIWSPDGQWITFTTRLSTWWTQIWHVSPNGRIVEKPGYSRSIHKSAQEEINRWLLHSEQSNLGELHPTWSPDGTHLAFTYSTVPHPDSVATGKNAAKTIWITSTDNDDPTYLTEGFWPAWSPDGEHILFLREDTQKGEFRSLWQIPPNGGEPQKILADISGITHIKWSPNGDRILFLTPPQDNLWVMQLSGTAFQPQLQNTD